MSRPGIFLLLFLSAVRLSAAGLDSVEFSLRRGATLNLLDSASAMVLRSAEVRMRSNDVEYTYRQESNFLYLTGCNSPNAILVLTPRGILLPDGRIATCVLFSDRSTMTSRGAQGIPVADMKTFGENFTRLCSSVRNMYISSPDLRFVNDWLNDRRLFIDRDARRQLEQTYPGLKARSVTSILTRLRQIKSSAEREAIRKAIAATGEGLRAAWRTCAPGRYEYELQAVIEGAMIAHGTAGPSFPSIVGSGPNALIPHYATNTRRMEKGDVVVLDVGAEVEGYAADITRTVPVSGSFTPGQRDIYRAVLAAQAAVIAAIRPGLPWSQLDRVAKASLNVSGLGRYLTHPVSHHLGLDVHDVGALDTLQSGMVITVEPGVYIPVNDSTMGLAYRGVGIRIEDDVLVTKEGAEILSAGIPKESDELEAVLKRK